MQKVAKNAFLRLEIKFDLVETLVQARNMSNWKINKKHTDRIQSTKQFNNQLQKNGNFALF